MTNENDDEATSEKITVLTVPGTEPEWWRTAVIYQIYPRSFADANGDGMGDLPGITARLDSLAELGIDALWLSPFMVSPQRDAGYDVADYCDVDPLFGSLADFDALLRAAHDLGIRVIIDIVPNHSSSEHPWFRQALLAAPGSAERARYLFRDGRGDHGELPPNNWQSVFGGDAWSRITESDGTPGQWYLHLFDSSQPDFDWNNPEVAAEFERILRFWLDRGVDGFRIDVAHGMVKADGLPNWQANSEAGSMGGDSDTSPYWGQPGVHEIYRSWRRLVDEYSGQRALCAEAWMPTAAETALWVRQDELHQAFNFPFLSASWDATELKNVIAESFAAFAGVGAPSTWVLSNHDVVRHATRLAIEFSNPQGDGLGSRSPHVDVALGRRRARAATTLMLGLPGSAYLYQGEELGLPEVIDLPDEARRDPTWERTKGERYGRDGCRVPLPWCHNAPSAGFNTTGKSWLPIPDGWASYSRDLQEQDHASSLTLYKRLLAARKSHGIGAGTLSWIEAGDEVVAYRNGNITVVANLGDAPVALPASGELLLASGALTENGELPTDTAVWVQSPSN